MGSQATRARLRRIAAELLLRSIELRLYASMHARQLRWDELVGGKRIFRITAARTVRRKLTAEHGRTVEALSAKPISTWNLEDLPAVLRVTRRRCTWPIPKQQQYVPPAVRAARLEN